MPDYKKYFVPNGANSSSYGKYMTAQDYTGGCGEYTGGGLIDTIFKGFNRMLIIAIVAIIVPMAVAIVTLSKRISVLKVSGIESSNYNNNVSGITFPTISNGTISFPASLNYVSGKVDLTGWPKDSGGRFIMPDSLPDTVDEKVELIPIKNIYGDIAYFPSWWPMGASTPDKVVDSARAIKIISTSTAVLWAGIILYLFFR